MCNNNTCTLVKKSEPKANQHPPRSGGAICGEWYKWPYLNSGIRNTAPSARGRLINLVTSLDARYNKDAINTHTKPKLL